MDRMGLVLGGGGAKGSYEIGAWEALEEVGVTHYITDISGTSVGALNAALMAQGDLTVANEIWDNIDKKFQVEAKDLLPILINHIAGIAKLAGDITLFFAKGILKRDELESIIDNNLHFETVKKYQGNVFATAVKGSLGDIASYKLKKKEGKLETIHFNITDAQNMEEVKQWLLASAAMPIVYGDVEIDEVKFYDGGVTMNVPVKPLKDNGIKDFIIIYCNHDEQLREEDKENINVLLELKPSEDMGAFINSTINFSKEYIHKTKMLGYKDTIVALNKLGEREWIDKSKLDNALKKVYLNNVLQQIKQGKEKIVVEGMEAEYLYQYMNSNKRARKKQEKNMVKLIEEIGLKTVITKLGPKFLFRNGLKKVVSVPVVIIAPVIAIPLKSIMFISTLWGVQSMADMKKLYDEIRTAYDEYGEEMKQLSQFVVECKKENELILVKKKNKNSIDKLSLKLKGTGGRKSNNKKGRLKDDGND